MTRYVRIVSCDSLSPVVKGCDTTVDHGLDGEDLTSLHLTRGL